MRHLLPRFAGVLLAVAVANPAGARTALQRDVEDYAVASCLANQDQAYLRDQGDGWASVIVQRAKGGLEPLKAVAAAVKTELAKGNMPVIRSESEPGKGKALPVLYCSEIVDAPAVRAAVDAAMKKLAASYRSR
ncbi:hypothetical protein JQ543_09845 [Bradyrhizobium diazoefficiens]|nr:hypothetical protein [Bradyrhizobium diazoefficiens]MBR0848041.1 hypothetical protein [Bradyrhizobium diazoefficiens]